jgi:hypothetical protein
VILEDFCCQKVGLIFQFLMVIVVKRG